MDIVKSHAGGTTFAEISKRSFRPLPILVPDPNVVKTFNSIVQPLYEKMKSNLIESKTLTSIRDMLLPKLMSGELRIRK